MGGKRERVGEEREYEKRDSSRRERERVGEEREEYATGMRTYVMFQVVNHTAKTKTTHQCCGCLFVSV